MKNIIAIDCDEILSSTVAWLLDFHGHSYNDIPMKRSDITLFDLHAIEKYSTDKEYDKRYWNHFFSSSASADLVPVPGSQDGIEALCTLWYDLQVVTNRIIGTHEMTKERIEKHFPGMFSDIVFWPATLDNYKIDKSVLLDRIGASYLVDDALHNCEQVAEKWYPSVLLDNPRNQTPNAHPLITRVNNRDEIVAYFTRRTSED